MLTFDDFDAWGEAVSGASLRLACNGIETRRWTLGMLDLGGVVLQVASEGSGTICYGASTHPGTLLFLPLTLAGEQVANGTPLDSGTLLAIPRGSDFQIHVRRRAHSWCSIALPFDVPHPRSWIARSEGGVPRLKRLVTSIAQSLIDRPSATAAHRGAGRALVAAASACLGEQREPRPQVGRPRLDRGDLIRRAMVAIEGHASTPAAGDLARDLGVTSRTLLRAFQEAFGVPPKRFLLLRQLHAVRRSLGESGSPDETVADVLTQHGIWEFGRFASRYRSHFGELPSHTWRRSRR
jgi:AraC-like DNA-binding protein